MKRIILAELVSGRFRLSGRNTVALLAEAVVYRVSLVG